MLTALWQATDFREHDWVCELFEPHLKEHIYDGDHKVVMDDCVLFDKFLHQRSPEYYARFSERHNVFLFHLSDEQYHGGYACYQNFDGVFRNYWSSVFTPDVTILPLGYSNETALKRPAKLASTRDYLWSFIGETRRASRPEMVSALSELPSHRCLSTDSGAALLSPQEYRALLENSALAPCPMGRINLECFRIYEALECGAIPVVERRLSLDYFRHLLGVHPLLTVRDWSEAKEMMLRLSEDSAGLDALQAEVSAWWSRKKHSLRAEVSAVLSKGGAGNKGRAASVSWPYDLPFWQPAELIRHQSPRGLLRRTRIQLGRALK